MPVTVVAAILFYYNILHSSSVTVFLCNLERDQQSLEEFLCCYGEIYFYFTCSSYFYKSADMHFKHIFSVLCIDDSFPFYMAKKGSCQPGIVKSE